MFTEDLAVFFNVAELGDAALYTPEGYVAPDPPEVPAYPVEISGHFDNGYSGAVDIEESETSFLCPLESVPGVTHGATLEVNGVTWTVRGVQKDETERVVRLKLERE